MMSWVATRGFAGSCEHVASGMCWGCPAQTGPTDCLHQCGNKRLCRLGVTPSISTLGSQMSEAPFCLYAACLLIEILHTGHSRLIPHQWKGCLGPVCDGRGEEVRREGFLPASLRAV